MNNPLSRLLAGALAAGAGSCQVRPLRPNCRPTRSLRLR